jgi:hypothetical protein
MNKRNLGLNKRLSILLSAMSLFSLLACGGGSDSESSDIDLPGTINPPNISAGDFNTMRASLVLQGIPEILETKDLSGNDRISITIRFDINEDSVISEGDLMLIVSASIDAVTGHSELSASLLRSLSDRYSGYDFLADVEYETNGNTVTFVVEKEQAEELNLVSSQTQINAAVSIWDKVTMVASSDQLPASNIYTQVQNNWSISDDLQDYSGDSNIIDISEFRLVFE